MITSAVRVVSSGILMTPPRREYWRCDPFWHLASGFVLEGADGKACVLPSANARAGVLSAKKVLPFAQQDRIDQQNHFICQPMLDERQSQR